MYESMWIEIMSNNVKYVIGGIYRHPNTNISEFKEKLLLTTNKIRRNKRCIFLGDLNIDLNKYAFDMNTKNFVDDLVSLKFLPFTFLPTRITTSSATIIDHIFSNCYLNSGTNIKSGLITADISDHLCNFMFVLTRINKKSYANRPYTRLMTKNNIVKYSNDLANVSWNEVYNSKDVNKSFNVFNDTLCKIFNTNFPLVKSSRKSNNNTKPWITSGLLQSINTKQKLYKKWILSRNINDYTIFKSFAKNLKKLLRQAESKYYKNILDYRFNSIKGVWNSLNKLCNPKYLRSGPKPTLEKLVINDKEVTNKQVICESFNEYFCNVGNNLANKLPDMGDKFKGYLPKPPVNSFFCSNIEFSELDSIISKLKNTKSAGLDNYSSNLIKLSKPYIISPTALYI